MHPDQIEAYVRSDDVGPILALLATHIGPLEPAAWHDVDSSLYRCGETSVLLTRGIDAGFISVWMWGSPPWASSPDLARTLSAGLRTAVRCDPGDRRPDVSPFSDTFLEICDGVERLVEWGP